MPAWTWFVVALAAGTMLLAAAALADRRARRRVTGAGESAPHRGIPDVDRHVPRYVTQDEVDALAPPSADPGGRPQHVGEGFAFGFVHPDFATSPAGAELRAARVLIIDGEVTSMRELLTPLRAAPGRPLVIVAAGFHPEVVQTLAANRRALRLPVLAAAADVRDRRRLGELLGAEPLTEADLRAGYVPDSAVGIAAHWASTATRSWVRSEA